MAEKAFPQVSAPEQGRIRVHWGPNPLNEKEKVWIITDPNGRIWCVTDSWYRAIGVANGVAKLYGAGILDEEIDD